MHNYKFLIMSLTRKLSLRGQQARPGLGQTLLVLGGQTVHQLLPRRKRLRHTSLLCVHLL